MDWNERIKSLESWSFGNTPEMADELGRLVVTGRKTATSSLFEVYEREELPLPTAGERSCILDSRNAPLCVIEVLEVEQIPFKNVREDFARCEGEGDLSLAHWRQVHREFFTRENPHFHDDMLVVCEKFRVIHRFSAIDSRPTAGCGLG